MDIESAQHTITSFPEKMTRLRHAVTKDGREIEFWSARDIQPELGYDDWVNFEAIIEKAIANCSRVGGSSKNHFFAVTKMVSIGSGAHREQIDYVLSRTACYLIALNGDPQKPQVAWAKAYFVVQTKLQESQAPQIDEAEERSRLRERLKDANKLLGQTAKSAGVENFAFFHDAGIRALYRMKMSELKSKKGVASKDDYWDHVGGLELSANEFKAQLARKNISQKKTRGEIVGQRGAELEHEKAGKAVRATVHKEVGVHLEDLPLEPSLKKILSSRKKSAKLAEATPAPALPPPAPEAPPAI
jgi:DNA-damage-inducible protein D